MAAAETEMPFVSLLMLILAPFAAFLIQMAISRSREYVADRDGAIIADNPRALANALARLQQGVKSIPMQANEATAHMFIMSPFLGSLGGFKNLFTTHPPADETNTAAACHGERRLWQLVMSHHLAYTHRKLLVDQHKGIALANDSVGSAYEASIG